MKFLTQRDFLPPLRLQEVYKILLQAAQNFSFRSPAAQHQKTKKSKKTQKKLFQSTWIPVTYFFHRKMPISSNFHFSSNLAGKLNFSIDTQFITLDLDKSNHTPKNLLFLTENYPLTIFPIQFPDKILIPFFRIFIQAISNSLITTIKFSFKNPTQKYKIS